MAEFRKVSANAWRFIALLAMALPESCYAENASNFFHVGPGELLIIGAVVALPTAILCVLAEAIFPRRRLPLWLTGLSAATAAISIALVVAAMKAAAQQRADSRLLVLFIVPPVVVLALRGMVSDVPPRLAAGWVITVTSLGLAAGRHPGEAAWWLAGGAAACLLLWTLTLLILRARRVFPAELPNTGHVTPRVALSAAGRRLAGVSNALSRSLPPGKGQGWPGQLVARLRPAQTGLIWWFASACVLYFGIGAAISTGKLGGGAWLYVEWQYVVGLFGLSYPKEFRPAHAWWAFGLPWSLLAGSAFWGLSGLLGGFDPGRARIVRFAAIVFGGALLVWTASIITRMAEVNEAEERASGIHR